MNTGSILDSFNLWHEVWYSWMESDLTGLAPGAPGNAVYNTVDGPMSITFAQVTQIESIRRKIEALQEELVKWQSCRLGYQMASDKWFTVPHNVAAAAREAMCKATAIEILGLLAEAEKEGVDITASKVALVDFMEEMKKRDAPCGDLSSV